MRLVIVHILYMRPRNCFEDAYLGVETVGPNDQFEHAGSAGAARWLGYFGWQRFSGEGDRRQRAKAAPPRSARQTLTSRWRKPISGNLTAWNGSGFQHRGGAPASMADPQHRFAKASWSNRAIAPETITAIPGGLIGPAKKQQDEANLNANLTCNATNRANPAPGTDRHPAPTAQLTRRSRPTSRRSPTPRPRLIIPPSSRRFRASPACVRSISATSSMPLPRPAS